MANTTSPATITYGDFTIDPAALPPVTIAALLRRGVAHYLGNEMASRVATRINQGAAEAVKALGDDADDAAKAEADRRFRDELSAETKAAWKAEAQKDGHAALLEGTIGEGSTRGPRKDPHEAACEAIAKEQVRVLLKSAGLREPRGDKTVTFGNGDEFTMAQLVERRLGNDKFRPGIEKEARRRVAEAEKAAKARGEVDASGPVDSADALGL